MGIFSFGLRTVEASVIHIPMPLTSDPLNFSNADIEFGLFETIVEQN